MKVSVVVATYKSPRPELAELVKSLDAQTMSASDFEVIFVDDGSPDDTYAHLTHLQSQRPNYRVYRLENSGWASRPRNFGIDRATGEYILFMDHDDRLYARSLETAHAYAREHNADVVNGKESYTNTPAWGLDTYIRDEGQSIARTDMHPLIPLNPHKLYRADFLRSNNIRFPEGRKILWEDQFFNILVAKHASRISTLSSVPFYHWVYTPGSGSSQFIKSSEDYWIMLRRVFESIRDELSSDALQQQRDLLFKHQYRVRILGVFNGSFSERGAEVQQFIFNNCRRLWAEFDLNRFDKDMGAARRLKARALAEDDLELMISLCTEDLDVTPTPKAVELKWVSGILQVQAEVSWETNAGIRLPLKWSGRGLRKQFSADVEQSLPEHLMDVTQEALQATLQIGVRSRTSRVVWQQLTNTRSMIVDDDEGPVIVTTATAVIDPRSAAMGASLDSTYWDIFGWSRMGDWMTHRGLRSSIDSKISLHDGHLDLAYSNDGGSATLIPDGHFEAVRRLEPERAAYIEGVGVVIDLAGKHDGRGSIGTKVAVRVPGENSWRDVPVRLLISESRAQLRFGEVSLPLEVRIGDRTGDRIPFRRLASEGEGLQLTWTESA